MRFVCSVSTDTDDDAADNSDPARLAHLDTETRNRLSVKYRAARAELGLDY